MVKHLTLSVLALAATMSLAHADTQALEDYLTIDSAETIVETRTRKGTFSSTMVVDGNGRGRSLDTLPGMPKNGGIAAGVATAGEVIRVGRDLVALGEAVYELVKKGAPVIRTDYAPISVLPKSGGEAIDVAETEGWEMPISRRVTMNYKNRLGATVVSFTYSVVFAYGGSYNGAGAFISGAQVIPSQVNASFGFTFESSMRLGGLTNHGTSADPVAGAMLNIQYKVNSIMSAVETNDTYHITGRGQIRKI
jgi:hypothetical protein